LLFLLLVSDKNFKDSECGRCKKTTAVTLSLKAKTTK